MYTYTNITDNIDSLMFHDVNKHFHQYGIQDGPCFLIKGNTKFWEILKIGWIVILYNVDIFGYPCGCIISTRKFSP